LGAEEAGMEGSARGEEEEEGLDRCGVQQP
jgi:hypothetical protein